MESEEVIGAIWAPNWDVTTADSLFPEKDQQSITSEVFKAFLLPTYDTQIGGGTINYFLHPPFSLSRCYTCSLKVLATVKKMPKESNNTNKLDSSVSSWRILGAAWKKT